MNYKHLTSLILALTLTTLACGLTAPASNAPTPAPVQETIPAPTEAAPSLTADQLKNAQYQLGARDDRAVIQLTDGKYQQGTDATTLDFAYIGLTQFVSVGDLTGDGVNEIAAIFLENYGGTGNFGLLTIYSNVNGLPVFLTSTFIDDRPMINSMSIENGEVFLDAITHGAQDGGCCPTLPTTRRYALVNNQLRMVNYTTATPEGAKRIVEITAPVNGAEASGSVQVSGTVSIAPFENNLTYFIYDEAGNQFAAGPVMVTAPDFGAPGTFNETFTLEGIPPGTTIYLEIQDISAADGSWLAMDAVKLVIK
ncbi:Gmad2 immunoglobulin-like domain-containing protein [Candidatus Villigracilis affinis]|uniref:Gmad2 immunoglobulin-like domain-containing protein n=1 Tax=Candidatus Villigracilis affinis TaxID=3140682 RepID=UPI002A20FCAC|nr:Gmad2 immunoglobulin-like domain-containing protein [Anaerolineales bacterium]